MESKFTVTATRTVDDDEAARRISLAYRLILEAAHRINNNAPEQPFAGEPGASDTDESQRQGDGSTETPEAQVGDYYDCR